MSLYIHTLTPNLKADYNSATPYDEINNLSNGINSAIANLINRISDHIKEHAVACGF